MKGFFWFLSNSKHRVLSVSRFNAQIPNKGVKTYFCSKKWTKVKKKSKKFWWYKKNVYICSSTKWQPVDYRIQLSIVEVLLYCYKKASRLFVKTLCVAKHLRTIFLWWQSCKQLVLSCFILCLCCGYSYAWSKGVAFFYGHLWTQEISAFALLSRNNSSF